MPSKKSARNEVQRITCAPHGAGRKRDRDEWENDATMPHPP